MNMVTDFIVAVARSLLRPIICGKSILACNIRGFYSLIGMLALVGVVFLLAKNMEGLGMYNNEFKVLWFVFVRFKQ